MLWLNNERYRQNNLRFSTKQIQKLKRFNRNRKKHPINRVTKKKKKKKKNIIKKKNRTNIVISDLNNQDINQSDQ